MSRCRPLKIVTLVFAAAVCVLGMTGTADAATLRYAIVVGNDVGHDPQGPALPPLQHAEREATRLRDSLVRLCSFSDSADRTVLLRGATRAELRDAVARVAEQMRRDRESYGETDTLFAFFFTGHGLSGRILMADGALGGAELGELFRTLRADFTVGVFDACFSGSLDPASLAAKGIKPAPGASLFRELPEEVLQAEGSMWFVSSGPDQLSYEDEELGGVFTHFLTEALERAPRDGPGITIERIWTYAQSRTVDYTTARARRQNPRQYVANLTLTGPLFFSFPLERSAGLALGEDVEGRFLLTYAGGQMSEVIRKDRGAPRTLAVYPGRATLALLANGEVQGQQRLNLQPNATVTVGTSLPAPGPPGFGRTSRTLWSKGFGPQTLTAVHDGPGTTLHLGAGYTVAAAPSGTLNATHTVGGGSGSIGTDSSSAQDSATASMGEFSAWSYHVHALVADVGLGGGFDVGPVRLSVEMRVVAARLWQRYGDDSQREGWSVAPGGRIAAIFPIVREIALSLHLDGGALWAPGVGRGAETHWTGWGGGGLGVLWRLP